MKKKKNEDALTTMARIARKYMKNPQRLSNPTAGGGSDIDAALSEPGVFDSYTRPHMGLKNTNKKKK